MNLRTFIERPVFSAVISITIVILGIIGLFTLPVEQYPIPWNQPIRNCKINIETMEETPTFVPNKRVAKADNVNPKGKNLRALLRSETPPIINLDNP